MQKLIGTFDNVLICGASFKGSKGAKINPQTIRDNNLELVNCCDVEFIGSFDGVKIYDTKFDGSNYQNIDFIENDFRQRIKTKVKQINYYAED